MDYKKYGLASSTGEGMKLRIKSLAFLILPLLNYIGDQYGFTIIAEKFEVWIDAVFITIAGVTHAWGWLRANKPKGIK
jgi:hypothetical protein